MSWWRPCLDTVCPGDMRLPAVSVLALAFLAGFSTAARAQLISPGKLSAAHASLEGMTNCTSCHELGKPGISDTKCLGCHRALQSRIARQAGLHAGFTGKPCASCHKEHFGVQFA